MLEETDPFQFYYDWWSKGLKLFVVRVLYNTYHFISSVV